MANEYIQVDDLKETLSLLGESFADQDVPVAIAAASRGLDELTGRRFWVDADANEVRYFTAVKATVVLIDDLVTFTAVAADLDGDGTHEEEWAAADVLLEPANAAADGRPWCQLTVRPTSSRAFPVRVPAGVKVTGKFGWPAVPDGIKSATTILATRLLKRAREAPFGIVGGFETAERIARTDPDVMFLVGPYVRAPFA